MKNLVPVTCLAASCLLAPGFVSAQSAPAATSPHSVTGNLAFVSQYRYRGIGQTNEKPAVQGGFDYAHASGLYLGTWATNVSWISDPQTPGVSSSMEWDFYGGYKGAITSDVGYDVGGLYYYYPGTYPGGFVKPNTFEIYGAVSWKTLTFKYSHATTDTFGLFDSKGSNYLDLTYTHEVASGFNLVAHVGRQNIKGPAKDACTYTDWKLGATYDAMGVTWGASYIDTNAKGGLGECYRNVHDKDLGKGTIVLSVTKTF